MVRSYRFMVKAPDARKSSKGRMVEVHAESQSQAKAFIQHGNPGSTVTFVSSWEDAYSQKMNRR